MQTELLEEIGLTKSEIKVYFALLELGSSSTGKIVDKSKVASSKIYEILDRLIQKGLVSYIIEAGTKQFEAADPKRILDYVNEKEEQLNQQKRELDNLIPQLELKKKWSQYQSKAAIFKGIKGAETAFADILETMEKGEEYYVMGATPSLPTFGRFIRNYHKRISKKGIKVKLLFSEQGKEWAEHIKDIPFIKLKFAPSQLFASSFISIYKNKILITVSTQKDIILFRIDNKEIADSFGSQFKWLWNQETRIIKGLDVIQTLFEDMLNYKEADLIGARGYFIDQRPKYVDEWEKRAIKKGFKWRNIVDIGVKGHRITKLSFAETKYNIPKEFSSLSVFWIYGNKVVITNWVEKEPIAVIIENKNLYKTYKEQFESLWNKKII